SLLKTAVSRYGVVAVPRICVERVVSDDDGWRLLGSDRLRGEGEMAWTARCVVEAVGAAEPPSGPAEGGRTPVTLSRGSHIVVRAHELETGAEAVVLPETEDGRLLFVIPWEGEVLVGTTDQVVSGSNGRMAAPIEDVDYLTRHLSRYFDVGQVNPLSSFTGLRVMEGSGDSKKASRRHSVHEPAPGYFRVVGGKLSSYRVTAAEGADRVAPRLGAGEGSPTSGIRLVGSGGDSGNLLSELVSRGLLEPFARQLARRYG